jgi:hypothetical protein
VDEAGGCDKTAKVTLQIEGRSFSLPFRIIWKIFIPEEDFHFILQ